MHVDNKRKDIFILGEGPTQELDDTTLAVEGKHPINFAQSGKRFVFINATKVQQFESKKSEIKDYVLCLGNVSKHFTINNMKKTALKEL